MIYDCILYAGESDVLSIRERELYNVVDRRVMVEATHTFQGAQRMLTGGLLIGEYLVHVTVDEPLPRDPWEAERYCRDAIMRGLVNADDDDFALICDVDEIPRADVVERFTAVQAVGQYHVGLGDVVALRNTSYYYRLDWQVPWEHALWPVLVRVGTLRRRDALGRQGPHAARYAPTRWVDDAGWHFSKLGTADDLVEQLNSYAHAEFRGLTPAAAEALIAEGRDFAGREDLIPVEIDETYPACIREHRQRWAHLTRAGA